jgi:dihydroorotate dehydrogenase
MGPLADIAYRRMLRPPLFRLDAERAHRLTLAILSRMPRRAPRGDPPILRTTLFGIEFSNPVGLAAGMDKDARGARAWNAIGFGFAEFGTITPRPQPGNPPPRMWRLPEHRALINRLGFPSDGIEAVAPRIERARRDRLRMRMAVNIGPNKETPPDRVAEDYASLMRRAGALADFVVVNLSSPNTPGLREFQAPERMRAVVKAIRSAGGGGAAPPLLIKIAPDLEPPMLREVCAAALELNLDGIVATNTTIERDKAGVVSTLPGGLSGEPLRSRAREVIAHVRAHTHARIPIIGVGGIAAAEDAYAHIRAGASLVELYTGLVYHGPGVISAIKRGLARLLIRDGFRSIGDAIGAGC